MIKETKAQKETRLKLNRTDDLRERENAFYTLYGVKSQKEILGLFEDEVKEIKITPIKKKLAKKAKEMQEQKSIEEQYPKILELILKYSHAIFYLYSKNQINKNIISFRKIAMININDENVNKAFKMINRLRDYKEEPKTKEHTQTINSDCVALSHIEKLKKDLEEDNIKANTAIKEDKRTYAKVGIVALATGARVGEILKDFEIDEATTIYDAKYIDRLLKEVQEYQNIRTDKNGTKKPFSERVVRNGIDNLKLPLSQQLKESEENSYQTSFEKWQEAHEKWEQSNKAQREPAKPILSTHCRNINHLNFLHKECSK